MEAVIEASYLAHAAATSGRMLLVTNRISHRTCIRRIHDLLDRNMHSDRERMQFGVRGPNRARNDS